MPLRPKLPARVKPSELTMINPVWIDIQQNPEEFVADTSVTFLWVMRGDGAIILGIEEPWRFPGAFDPSVHDKLEEMREHYETRAKLWAELGEKDGSGGHPTLAAWFAETGEASDYAGFAYLGGELKYQDGHWVLSNESGRFGRGQELRDGSVSEEDVRETMQAAATRIDELLGLTVQLKFRG